MKWDEGLSDEQKKAAKHIGTHARLLAGPGTGKTLTLQRHVAFLINEKKISPDRILALTFTRAAAHELRKRIIEVLDENQKIPQVSTLHSFALAQLLHNIDHLNTIPKPLRIADNWEERKIIFEDLKIILGYKLKDVKEKFSLLSADWQTLVADDADWEKKFADPKFLGAWQQHRKIFGYTLRSELVYQLKRALERVGSFQFDAAYSNLLIDEYQDLNRCDLAVIASFKDRGVQVYCAGDDDQSIYGFRFAHPEGIRRFDKEFLPCTQLTLETCIRCDKEIIDLAIFVAKLDPFRIEKPFKPKPGAGDGEVRLIRFEDQNDEANGIATICEYLIRKLAYQPNDIMILMRGDRNGVFSKTIRDRLMSKEIPIKIQESETPLDSDDGRYLLALLRLSINPSDNLSFRTLLMLKHGIGYQSIFSIYKFAQHSGNNFISAANSICENPLLIPKVGQRICDAVKEINNIFGKYSSSIQELNNQKNQEKLIEFLTKFANEIIENKENRKEILEYCINLIKETESETINDFLTGLSSINQRIEQELATDKVNMMTMHKAKGLTSKAVIIIACEDETIPGKQENGEKEGDERRLLYVSLSRAKHFLAITYCDQRTGAQIFSGRSNGTPYRNLTRFLEHAPVIPIVGKRYLETIAKK
ncbi:MAG: ATP-dependent helicase [Methanoregula sp.]|jgi:DNA helicase-2/ATP-dependent DNA helicase PcrA|uniref:ATP-dependent helicase n=1 Tax=Methanoregula sp. TaxID=2052170 RepID=UPI003D0BBFDB